MEVSGLVGSGTAIGSTDIARSEVEDAIVLECKGTRSLMLRWRKSKQARVAVARLQSRHAPGWLEKHPRPVQHCSCSSAKAKQGANQLYPRASPRDFARAWPDGFLATRCDSAVQKWRSVSRKSAEKCAARQTLAEPQHPSSLSWPALPTAHHIGPSLLSDTSTPTP